MFDGLAPSRLDGYLRGLTMDAIFPLCKFYGVEVGNPFLQLLPSYELIWFAYAIKHWHCST